MGEKRERFGSRLGFILVSAGCAIGLGNVYKFPIWCGAYGGGIFLLFYILFLVILGIPVITEELAVGRGSGRSIATSFDVLEKKGHKWHLWKYAGVVGNYFLMMFYTCITGWFVQYFIKYLDGSILTATEGLELADATVALGGVFGGIATTLGTNVIFTYIVIIVGFGICAMGLQNGVEKITKVMMICLFVLLIGLVIYACTLSGVGEGIRFYLVPSVSRFKESGFTTVISAAMSQAFFTLSLGIGSIAIFGSYIGKEKSLLGEGLTIIGLDTFVALMSGLIIFPAFFTFNPGATSVVSEPGTVGAGFLFTTLSSIFNHMAGGRIVGILFFLFMIFAAMSTVVAVFENIVSFWIEGTNLSRKKISLINMLMMAVLVLPFILANCVDTSIFAKAIFLGRNFGDFEDFFVSNLCLPIGCMIYTVFCTTRFGWGWDNYLTEVNAGSGLKMPKWLRPYMTYVLPLIIGVVVIMSLT